MITFSNDKIQDEFDLYGKAPQTPLNNRCFF